MRSLAGTGKLVRLIVRRDRVVAPLWIVFVAVVPIGFVSSFSALYPTAAARRQFAATSGHDGVFVALYGRLSGSSLGELVAWRAGFVPVVVGLISILIVIRHTRTEEESGRLELIGSTAVGRHAGLAAALIATCGGEVILAALVAVGMVSQHLPVAGSLAFGAQLAAAGWLFAGIGAVAAQLAAAAGAARGIAISALGAAYLLRVGGDLSAQSGGAAGWLSWLSPIGWVQRIHPYGGDRWWILLPVVGVTAGMAATAVALSARRDLGAGLLPARPGPAAASPRLRTPLALGWRLHRALLAAWLLGLVVVGAVLGAVAKGVGSLVGDNRKLQDIFTRLGGRAAITDAYLAAMMGLLALMAAAYAVQAALRLRAEETSGRAEPVLSTAVSRLQWAGSHFVFSILGPAAALAAGGLATGLTYGLDAGQVGRQVPRVLGAAVVQLPAVWVLAGLAIAAIGLLPRWAAATWAALALCVLFGLVGAALQLNQWLLDLSPFSHIPKAPAASVSPMPLLWLGAIAVALALAGLVGLRQRAIPT